MRGARGDFGQAERRTETGPQTGGGGGHPVGKLAGKTGRDRERPGKTRMLFASVQRKGAVGGADLRRQDQARKGNGDGVEGTLAAI
jgi:hypothetical protein